MVGGTTGRPGTTLGIQGCIQTTRNSRGTLPDPGSGTVHTGWSIKVWNRKTTIKQCHFHLTLFRCSKQKVLHNCYFSGSLEVQKLIFLIVFFLFQRFMGCTVLYLANFLYSSIIYWFIFYSTNNVQSTWTPFIAYVNMYCTV